MTKNKDTPQRKKMQVRVDVGGVVPWLIVVYLINPDLLPLLEHFIK